MKNISIQIPAIPENIRMIESFIDNAKENFQMDDDIYGNIMISVTEAVNNAINHGCSGNPKLNVSLTLLVDNSAVKFRIKDEGPGFDYGEVPDPTQPQNLEKPTGRGIFLMKHLADEVTFSENGTLVELCFYNAKG